MIYLYGDTHGQFEKLKRVSTFLNPSDILIHLGDFGFYYRELYEWNAMHFPDGFPCKILAIDGNHEDFSLLQHYPIDTVTGLRHIFKNLYHVPRGTVMELEGKLFGFLGGAESIDKSFRTEGVSWWSDETISEMDVNTLINNVGDRQLDYLITHTCTARFRDKHFGPLNTKHWKLPDNWIDVSMTMVDRVVDTLTPKVHIFGHMHKSIRDNNTICLNIDEVIELPQI